MPFGTGRGGASAQAAEASAMPSAGGTEIAPQWQMVMMPVCPDGNAAGRAQSPMPCAMLPGMPPGGLSPRADTPIPRPPSVGAPFMPSRPESPSPYMPFSTASIGEMPLPATYLPQPYGQQSYGSASPAFGQSYGSASPAFGQPGGSDGNLERRLEHLFAELRIHIDARLEEHGHHIKEFAFAEESRHAEHMKRLDEMGDRVTKPYEGGSRKSLARVHMAENQQLPEMHEMVAATKSDGQKNKVVAIVESRFNEEVDSDKSGEAADDFSNGDPDAELEAQVEEHMKDKFVKKSSKAAGRSKGANKGKKDELWVDGEGCCSGFQRRFVTFVRSDNFDYLMGFFIVLNTIYLGVQVDLKARQKLGQKENADIQFFYSITETVFAFVFTLELFARLAAYRLRLFLSGWFYMDLIIVAAAVVEELLKYGIGGDSLAGKLSVFRMVRIFKVMRTFRVIRVIRAFRELRVVVMSIASCARSLFWTLCLLFVLIYMVSVLVLVELTGNDNAYDDTPQGLVRQNQFPNLVYSLYTLFQASTGGLDWAVPAAALEDVIPWIGMVWMLFIITTVFAISNTITGIFVDQAMKSALDDVRNVQQEETDKKDVMVTKIRQMAFDADCEGNGVLTRSQIEKICSQLKMKKELKELDIDIRDMFLMFDMVSAPNHYILLADIDEFTRDCFRLKGLAKNIDVVALSYQLRVKLREQTFEQTRMIEDKMEAVVAFARANTVAIEEGDEVKTSKTDPAGIRRVSSASSRAASKNK